MAVTMLTRDQERRLATHLRLLLDDLDALAALPDLMGAAGERVRRLVDEARAAALALRATLGLAEDHGPTVGRRVANTAEVWAVRVADLRAGRLRAYGDVHPDLSGALDPALERLPRTLLALADAAGELTER